MSQTSTFPVPARDRFVECDKPDAAIAYCESRKDFWPFARELRFVPSMFEGTVLRAEFQGNVIQIELVPCKLHPWPTPAELFIPGREEPFLLQDVRQAYAYLLAVYC
jgi:hypothetical protein